MLNELCDTNKDTADSTWKVCGHCRVVRSMACLPYLISKIGLVTSKHIIARQMNFCNFFEISLKRTRCDVYYMFTQSNFRKIITKIYFYQFFINLWKINEKCSSTTQFLVWKMKFDMINWNSIRMQSWLCIGKNDYSSPI